MVSLSQKVKKLQAQGKSSSFINAFILKERKKLKKIEVGPVQKLKPKKKKKKTVKKKAAQALDILSATLLEPTTFIKSPVKAGELVAERRAAITKTKDISKALDVVGEAVTSTLIAGGLVLGAANPALAGKAALAALPKTVKGQLTALTAGGILVTSEKARGFATKFFQDPTKIGREAGLIIDKAVAGKDLGPLGEVFKKAGIVGGIVAGGAGAIALGKKFLGGDKSPDQAINTPSDVPSSIALPQSSIPDALSPITDDPVIEASPSEEPTSKEPAAVNVKVINKPQINVAVAQSL